MTNETLKSEVAADSELNKSSSSVADKIRRRRKKRVRILNAALIVVFCVLAFFANAIPFFKWDLAITNHLQSFTILRPLMSFVSLFGDGFIPHLITAFTVLVFILFRLRHEAFWLIFSAGFSSLLNALMKRFIARPRPTDEFVNILQQPGGLSFPSGHVTFYVCYFGFLFFLVYRNVPRQSPIRTPLLILLLLPILLVGLSRVYLGAHWASDTLGAYLWSSVWLMLSYNLYQKGKESRRVTSDE